MRKILYIIAVSLGLMLCSCVTKVDDTFDKSASERLDEWINEFKDVLVSSPNGWLMSYFPSDGVTYGGFNLLVKFSEDGSVQVASELADVPSTVVTSHYSVKPYTGATLSFDTYNEFIHYFSDPDSGSNSIRGETMDGDFEFSYWGTDGDVMTIKGLKHSLKTKLTKMPEDVTWEEYLQSIADIDESVANSFYGTFNMIYGDNILVLNLDDSYKVFTHTDLSNPDATSNIGYITTPEGILFYEPFEWEGMTVQTFEWDGDKFVSTDAVNSSGASVSVVLEGFYVSGFVHYYDMLGSWTIQYRTGSSSSAGIATVDVTLSEKEYGKTITMSGLYGDYEAELVYVKAKGSLSFVYQMIGMDGDNYVYLVPYSTAGYSTLTTGVGFNISRSEENSPIVLTFSHNGVWTSYNTTGFIVRSFSTSPPVSSSAVSSLKYFYTFETMMKN